MIRCYPFSHGGSRGPRLAVVRHFRLRHFNTSPLETTGRRLRWSHVAAKGHLYGHLIGRFGSLQQSSQSQSVALSLFSRTIFIVGTVLQHFFSYSSAAHVRCCCFLLSAWPRRRHRVVDGAVCWLRLPGISFIRRGRFVLALALIAVEKQECIASGWLSNSGINWLHL